MNNGVTAILGVWQISPVKLCLKICLLKSSYNFKRKNRVNLERAPCITRSIFKIIPLPPQFTHILCIFNQQALPIAADIGPHQLPELSRAVKLKGNYFSLSVEQPNEKRGFPQWTLFWDKGIRFSSNTQGHFCLKQEVPGKPKLFYAGTQEPKMESSTLRLLRS